MEVIVHYEITLMEIDKGHYMDLCATLEKENNEIEEESAWLKTAVKETMYAIPKVELEEDQQMEVDL